MESTGIITSADFQEVISALTNQISVSSVVEVLAAVIVVCVGLVFMWWGVRKVASMLMAAFRRGRLSV